MDYKPPLSISFVWDRSDNDGIKEILDDLSNKLSKDPNNPFSRKLDIPTFYFQSTYLASINLAGSASIILAG